MVRADHDRTTVTPQSHNKVTTAQRTARLLECAPAAKGNDRGGEPS